MTIYVYVCPKCGRPHSLEEFNESRFCRHCGKFLSSRDKRVVEETTTKKEKMLKPNDIKGSIEKTYELIRRSIPHYTLIDSLEVVNQVEQYRQFWRPEETNVVLLAESHVYTNKQDHEVECRRSILDDIQLPEDPNYPVNFVRFVYCLGYGENDLLTKRIDGNDMGTWQFWKIFSYCTAESEMKILKMGTPNPVQRLLNKINVLRKMRDRGVWLLDASIVGLAGSGLKEYPDDCNKIIRLCWNNHLERAIKGAQPKYIMVIGADVGRVLHFELKKLEIPFMTIEAPQARLDSQRQQENYEKYERICAKYC